jgi:hypothetical protein
MTTLLPGHPLGVAVGDQPAAAVGVLVPEDPSMKA